MHDGAPTPGPALSVVAALGREFARIEAGEQVRREAPRRASRLTRRMIAIGVAAGLVTAAAAGAATGLLPVGSIIPAGDGALPGETDRVVVATGTAPVAGDWQLTAYGSGRLSDPKDGAVYQSAGLPCLNLALSDPVNGGVGSSGGFCGEFPKSPGFSRSQQQVVDGKGGRELLIYGRAPEQATAVEVTGNGHTTLIEPTHSAPEGVEGDFWLVAAPWSLSEGHVRWLDEETGEQGPRLELLPNGAGDYRRLEAVPTQPPAQP